MLSPDGRRRAASLSIVLILLLIVSNLEANQTKDSEPENSNNNFQAQALPVDFGNSRCNTMLYQLINENSELNIANLQAASTQLPTLNSYPDFSLFQNIEKWSGIEEENLQVSELDSFLICYNPPVDSDKTAEKISKNLYVTNEAAATENEKVSIQKEKRDLRSVTKEASKKTEKDTISKNSVEPPVNVQDRGEVFVYQDPVEHTEEDELFLAQLIHGEAGNQPIMERYRCGNVALNRYKDQTGRFPQNTMKGVAYASGQFGCTLASAWLHPTEEDKQIARDLFAGKCVFPDDIVFFNNTWDNGFFYCKPGYHCFSGYLDHNENAGDLVASAKAYKSAPKKAKAQVEVVQEEVDNSETNESQPEVIPEEINNENVEPEITEDIPNEQHVPEISEESDI